LIALAVSSASCDQGKVHDEAPAAGPAVHLLGANVVGGLLEPSDRIEVSFDRLLLPLSITRQTFILGELVGDQFLGLTPTIRYDPVARVVTVTPLPEQAFDPEQTYRLTIASPAGPTDVNGLRAIDGATLSATSPSSVTFRVAMDAGTSAPPPAPPPPPRSNVPAYVTLGLAGAGLIVGGAFGGLALGAKSTFNKTPTTANADTTDRDALISDMSFAVALTFGVTGVVLLVSNDSPPPAATQSGLPPKQAAVRGFVTPYATPHGGGAGAFLTF
jgi:hypothetical protein